LRDVPDCKVAAGGSDRLHTSSPFNIKVRSITLRDFNAKEEVLPRVLAQGPQDSLPIIRPSWLNDRDRMDLCLGYGEVTLGIELKVWRTRKIDPWSKGLEQLDGYLAR
jgi:hypothetical protein